MYTPPGVGATSFSVHSVSTPIEILKLIPSPKYTVDWSKVTTIDDIKAILEGLQFTVSPLSMAHIKLKPYLKMEPEA